jgi:acetolactate synthase-1/2/3 large subunit
MTDVMLMKQQARFNYKVDNKMKVQDVLIELNKEIKNKNYYITTGVGNHQQFTSMYIEFTQPNKILTSGSAGTMGVCLPYLIGAYYGNNEDKLLIGIDGDGSFNMTHVELQHVAEYKIPVKIFIMNDKKLQMVATWQELFFDGNMIATNSYNPDYTKLCDAWNIKCVKITNKTELNNAFKYLHSDEPVIFDCHVTPTQCLPLVAPGKPLHEMILYDETKCNNLFDECNFKKSDVPG